MFYLHVANRTEKLLRHLAHILAGTEERPDFFAPELFLIQSQGMERMVAQSLADHFGSFCNFQFFLPLDFLGYIAKRLDLGISPDGFGRQVMAWRLDELLRDLEAEEYQPLRYYLSGENGELKRFQLARRLANIFDQYQVLRSEFLSLWEVGKLATDNPAEIWQMALWRRLLEGPGGNMHRGVQFRRVIERLSGEDELSSLLPKRISVIGLHTMPPIFLEYLNRLAGHMDVHLLLLSPCRHYWGDVLSQRAQLKRQALQPYAEQMVAEEHHPLLAALGRQGRDFHNMLLENVEFFQESDGYDEPLEGDDYAEASLLQRVQADLLDDRIIEHQSTSPRDRDDSLQVVSCHSRLRELQVLKDHLLALLHRDSSLELRQIVVMAPDIQEYAVLIPAVFFDIQHSIADRSMRRRNSTIAAFLAFVDLFTGRFGWSEVFDLLRRPTVHPQFQLAAGDLDTLQQWIIGSGIRWGLSGEQRGEEGLPEFVETSWRAGLDRLLMGYAIEDKELIDGVLPYPDIEGRGAQPLGGLCRFIGLIEQARREFQQPRTLVQWSVILLYYGKQLFGDSDERELVELRAILAEPIEAMSTFHGSQVGFPVIHEWLNLSARESRTSSGFLRGQLTFCSMLPMRSIPFQVVCLLGLNDGVFPKNDNHDTFDLMAGDFRPGDRSPRADDRYQFLEALLAARSHLYLSYIGQSIQSGEAIPPSTVVSEFLELLETSYGVRDVVINHPLHPFSSKYFAAGGNEKLFSYNDYFCRIAATLQRGARPKEEWWQGRVGAEMATLHLADLLRFAASPQKFFVTNILGIRLDLGALLPDERELFQSTGLDRYLVDQDLLQLGLDGRLTSGFATVVAEGRWPLGAPGELSFSEKSRAIDNFLSRVEAQQMGQKQPGFPVDLALGEYRLVGTLSNVYEQGILLLRFGKLRGRDLLIGWIHHLLAQRLLPGTITRLVSLDTIIGFDEQSEGPDLERLLTLFAEGCRRPLPLFLEPGLVYAMQEANPKSRTAPIDKAMAAYRASMDKGYEPEWALLYGNSSAEEVLGAEFEDLCREIFCSLWGSANAI
ncbi:MAG: exodeoxyribonuclease V subunit gamma [Proteobacteria bacterium]|nr:exodeoxyribonuclease V subunit gamma [Pseudomonadota bacterium]